MPDPAFSTMPVSSATAPTAAFGPPSTGNLGFSDVQKALQLQTPGSPYLERAITATQPSIGLSPDAQAAIDLINKQRDYYAGLGASSAQGLALARGQAGSSTEQFGVQQAINQANLSAMNATGGILTQNMGQNAALRQLQGQILGGYGQGLNQTQGYLTGMGGQLTSDELASLRNMGLTQQYLGLQQNLGQQGINLGYANIGAAQNLANLQSRNQLLTAGAGLLPSILGGGGMFGGGGGGGFFGGGNLFPGLANYGMTPGAMSGVGTGGMGYSSFMPGGGGMVGTGATMMGGTGGMGGGLSLGGVGALAGAGLGAMQLANWGQNQGGTIGSFLANPIGAQLNLAKSALSSGGNAISNAVSDVGSAVSNVFPF